MRGGGGGGGERGGCEIIDLNYWGLMEMTGCRSAGPAGQADCRRCEPTLRLFPTSDTTLSTARSGNWPSLSTSTQAPTLCRLSQFP